MKHSYTLKTGLAILPLLLAQAAFAQQVTEKETMVVTATGFDQKIQNAPASISVIKQEQLADKAYRDVTDALKDIPGVVITGGGSQSDISIRGMGSQYTLILVDGKKVSTRATRPNSDNSGMEQGWLPPLQSIERIEVIRGPMSSLYGSDAMGGVINIITKKTSTQKKWTGSLKSEATFQENRDAGDMFQSDVYVSGPIIRDVLGAKFTGLISRRSEDKILSGFREQKMRSGSAALTLTPNQNNDIEFEFTRSLQDRNSTPEYSAAKESCSKKSGCQPNTKSDVRYERSVYSLTHNGHFDFGNIKSYVQHEYANNPVRQMQAYNTIANTQSQFNLDRHSVVLGGQYSLEEIKDKGNRLQTTNKSSVADKLTRWSWAAFTEDSWSITESFTLTSGIRLDRDENYGSHWTPKIYGVWNISDQWILKGGASTGYRSPDLRQSSANWGQITGGGRSDGVIIGNPNLKPEKSLSEEISLLWDNEAGLNVGVTIFNTEFKDKITEIRRCSHKLDPACTIGSQPFDFISDRVNVDKANMRGLELTLDWTLIESVKLSSNYTYTKSKQKSGSFIGKPLNQMPKHMFNTSIDWQIIPDLGVWSRFNFKGRTSEYLSRTSMRDGTPSYTFVDLGARYQLGDHITFSSGVYNLFDKKVDYDTYNAVLDGRRYNVGVSVSF